MTATAPVREVQTSVRSLSERIEDEARELSFILERPHSREELAAATARLNGSVYNLMLSVELLEKLLDGDTPDASRRQIREMLRSMAVRVEERRGRIERQRRRANGLIRRSMALVSKAQRLLNQQTAQPEALEDAFFESTPSAGGEAVQ